MGILENGVVLSLNKKILFIIPPQGAIGSFKPKGWQKKLFLTAPYGLLSMASYINVEKKYEIEILDCNKIIFENINAPDLEPVVINAIVDKVVLMQPDCVGVSALFNTNMPQMKLLCHIKKHCPKTYLIIGGGVATNMYQELLDEFSEIDAVCYGEGEIPLRKLMDSDFTDPSLLSLAWITRESLLRGQKPEYEFVYNLDELPLIGYSYIDVNKYSGRSFEDKNSESKVEVTIHTSRGCPFNCVFCASNRVHGNKIRMLSLCRVIDTIKHYKTVYGMTILIVEDDHFLCDKERALGILHFVKEIGVHIEFATGISVHKVDEDIATALFDAGVKIITLAIESGSDYVLTKLINKPLTVKRIEYAVGFLKKYDIRIHAFVVIGIPGELDVHRQETLDLLLRLEFDWVYVFIAIPLVGSRLYDICKTNGYFIDADYNNHTVTKCNIKAPGVDPKQIEQYAYYINAVVNLLDNSNMKNGKYDIAERYFKMVVDSYPKEAIAHYMLSKVYAATGNLVKQSEHYYAYLQYYEEHLSAYRDNTLWSDLLKTKLPKEPH